MDWVGHLEGDHLKLGITLLIVGIESNKFTSIPIDKVNG